MTEKELLCKRFVVNPHDDDIYEIVEQLIDLRTESCHCVFPSPKVCPRTADAPTQFGFCSAHMKTRKATDLATRWNEILEELDVQESESENGEDTEEQVSSEEEVVAPPVKVVPPSRTVRQLKLEEPPARSRPEPNRLQVSAHSEPAKRQLSTKSEPAKPRGRPLLQTLSEPAKPTVTSKKSNIQVEVPVEEEESLAEGSAKAVYVEEEEDESPKLTPLVFKMGKFNNYVNEEYKFVLRLHDETILGTENKTGGIVKLTPALIKVCKEHNLNYLE